MNRRTVKLFILCFILMLVSLGAYAKKTPPTPELGGAPPPPPGLPIDGGLTLLLASGLVYGIYSLKRKK